MKSSRINEFMTLYCRGGRRKLHEVVIGRLSPQREEIRATGWVDKCWFLIHEKNCSTSSTDSQCCLIFNNDLDHSISLISWLLYSP